MYIIFGGFDIYWIVSVYHGRRFCTFGLFCTLLFLYMLVIGFDTYWVYNDNWFWHELYSEHLISLIRLMHFSYWGCFKSKITIKMFIQNRILFFIIIPIKIYNSFKENQWTNKKTHWWVMQCGIHRNDIHIAWINIGIFYSWFDEEFFFKSGFIENN